MSRFQPKTAKLFRPQHDLNFFSEYAASVEFDPSFNGYIFKGIEPDAVPTLLPHGSSLEFTVELHKNPDGSFDVPRCGDFLRGVDLERYAIICKHARKELLNGAHTRDSVICVNLCNLAEDPQIMCSDAPEITHAVIKTLNMNFKKKRGIQK